MRICGLTNDSKSWKSFRNAPKTNVEPNPLQRAGNIDAGRPRLTGPIPPLPTKSTLPERFKNDALVPEALKQTCHTSK